MLDTKGKVIYTHPYKYSNIVLCFVFLYPIIKFTQDYVIKIKIGLITFTYIIWDNLKIYFLQT